MSDIEAIVLDEIALEGLNGVRLSRLWTLLEQRQPPFPLTCNTYTKAFLWQELLLQHQSLLIYTAPEEEQQEPPTPESTPTKKRTKELKEIKEKVKAAVIDDAVTHEMGYCPNYTQRTNVTQTIRNDPAFTSVEEVTKQWGDSLVLVASQEERLRALLTPMNSVDTPLATMYYCCLEHVAKCRHAGSSQSSLAARFHLEFSYIFLMCKNLARQGVVIKETMENSAHIYLYRFKPETQYSLSDRLGKKIVEYLSTQPQMMVPRYVLVESMQMVEGEEIGYGKFKKVLASLKMSRVVETVAIPAKKLPQYPGPEAVRTLQQRAGHKISTKSPADYTIVCIKLAARREAGTVDKDEDDDEDDDYDPAHGLASISSGKHFSSLETVLGQTEIEQVYNFIANKQKELNGVSQQTVRNSFHLDRYKVRRTLIRLERAGLIKNYSFNLGRVRECRYFTQKSLESGNAPEDALGLYRASKKPTPATIEQPEKGEQPSKTRASENIASSHVGSSVVDEPGVSSEVKGQAAEATAVDILKPEMSKVSQTWKNLQRRSLILDYIKLVRVTELYLLHKHIKTKEAEMGSKTECCRKSLSRMVGILASEGKVKSLRREIQRKKESAAEFIKLVADPNMRDDDKLIQMCVDNAIAKPVFKREQKVMPNLYSKLKQKSKKSKKVIEISDVLRSKIYNSMERRKIMEQYGHCGKMQRMEVLHKYLWYLIYEHQQDKPLEMEPLNWQPFPSPKEQAADSGGSERCEERSGAKANTKGDKTAEQVLAEMAKGAVEEKVEEKEDAIEDAKASGSGSQTAHGEWDVQALLTAMEEGSHTHIGRYRDTADPEDWRRYVPPGRFHQGRVRGWATMNDVIFSMPLSIFLQLTSLPRIIPGLKEFLDHPTKRHYPLTHLPPAVLAAIRNITRSLASVHQSLLGLSGAGLLFFDQDQKNRYQLRKTASIYLCQGGSILDTTSSRPCYDQVEVKAYPMKTYAFSNAFDVDQFWVELKLVCFSTPLGLVKKLSSNISRRRQGHARLDSAQTRNALCMIAMDSYSAPPIPTVIPGDRRGAAGLDTSYFAHRTSAWKKTKCKYSKNPPPKKRRELKGKKKKKDEDGGNLSEGNIQMGRVSAELHKRATVGGKGQKRKRPAKAPANPDNPGGAGGSGGPGTVVRPGPKAKKVKTSKLNSQFLLARNKHISDQRDLLASQRKILQRVKWSAKEDNLLMLCALTMRILRPKCNKSDTSKLFVSWSVVRDLLQDSLEESCDKTSASAPRRLRVLMKDPINQSNFAVCLTDIQADESIMKDFLSRKADYEDPAVCREEFNELCMVIARKFESHDEGKILKLPSTLRELHERYQVKEGALPAAMTMEDFESQDVSSKEDILHSVLFKIVVMSMLSHHFKQRNMKEIFYALRQYDQGLLEKAVAEFKSYGYMGRNRKSFVEGVNTSRALHFIPMSFQFTRAFFDHLAAPSVPAKALDDTMEGLTALRGVFGKEDSPDVDKEDTPPVCIDDVVTKKANLLCLPVLELVDDSISIPKDIVILEMSASDREQLRKKHEEEMRQGAEEDDQEEDIENDAQDTSSDHVRQIRRRLTLNTVRKTVSFVRSAHTEWRKSLKDIPVKWPKKTTSKMASLIPRLVISKEQMEESPQEVDDSSKDSSTQEAGIAEIGPQTVALDHDYLIPRLGDDGKESPKPDGASASSTEQPEEPSCKGSVANADKPIPSILTASDLEGGGSSCPGDASSTDSFYTWLSMQDYLTKEMSRRPQGIHEDITIRRCSISLKPHPPLIKMLSESSVLAKAAQDGLQKSPAQDGPATLGKSKMGSGNVNTSKKLSNQPCPIPAARRSESNIQSSQDCQLLSQQGNVVDSADFPVLLESLGEVICKPLQHFKPFHWSAVNIDHLPLEECTIRVPGASLSAVCSGHKHKDLLRSVYQVIREGGDGGITYPSLFSLLGPQRLSEREKVLPCVHSLLASQLVLEVGTTVVRLVDLECASHWLLKSVRTVTALEPGVAAVEGKTDSALATKKTRVDQETPSEGDVEVPRRDEDADGRPQEGQEGVSGVEERQGEELGEGDVEGLLGSEHSVMSDILSLSQRVESILDECAEAAAASSNAEEGKRVERPVEEAVGSMEDGATAKSSIADELQTAESNTRGKKRKKVMPEIEERLHVKYVPVTFVPHTWINIDGTMNGRSLSVFLTSVGLLVISKPGIKESDLFHHFRTVLNPVECLHLLKLLVNGRIVTRHATFCPLKLPGLFSRPSNMKPRAAVYYHPTTAALLNLSLLRSRLLQKVPDALKL